MVSIGKLEWRLVRLPRELITRIDAWALSRGKKRAEAVRHMVELGLKQALARQRRDDKAIERLAEKQIDQMMDPATSEEERKRRIHRLTEGPPEFVDVRVDLPRRRKD